MRYPNKPTYGGDQATGSGTGGLQWTNHYSHWKKVYMGIKENIILGMAFSLKCFSDKIWNVTWCFL